MEVKIARAVEGRLVRNPIDGIPITEKGTLVKVNSFMLRRVQDGDLTLHDVPAEKKQVNQKNDEGGKK